MARILTLLRIWPFAALTCVALFAMASLAAAKTPFRTDECKSPNLSSMVEASPCNNNGQCLKREEQTIAPLANLPTSDGLLRDHQSIPTVERDQAKGTFQLADDVSLHNRLPIWVRQPGGRPVFAHVSVQVLFCTWQA